MSTETRSLEQQAAELRRVANAPTERELAARELAEVETKIAEQRKQEAQEGAKARMLGIKKAHGSLRDTYREDAERVRTAMDTLNEAVEKMNARFEKLTELELEARDIGIDFGLPVPDFADLKGRHPTPPADLLRVAPTVRPLDVNDAMRMRRQHDAKREGPAATRYDFR